MKPILTFILTISLFLNFGKSNAQSSVSFSESYYGLTYNVSYDGFFGMDLPDGFSLSANLEGNGQWPSNFVFYPVRAAPGIYGSYPVTMNLIHDSPSSKYYVGFVSDSMGRSYQIEYSVAELPGGFQVYLTIRRTS